MNKGWQIKTLGEVLVRTETIDPTRKPQTEFDYIDVSSVSNDTLTIQETQRLKGKDAPSRARKLVKANDILFATIRPTLQRIAIVPDELDGQVCSTGYFVLQPKSDLDYRFIFYFLQTRDFMTAMETRQKGASYPAVTDGDVRSQPIPIPPLPEQKRIVAILDEAFAGIATAKANAEQNLKNSRELFESHLQSVFTKKGEGWVEKKLGDICEYFNGKAHERCINAKGKFIVINSKFISSNSRIFKRSNQALFPLISGDIAMVLSDVPNGKALAKCFIVDEPNKYTLNQRICVIRSKNFHTKFLYYQLNRNKHFLQYDNGENQSNLRLGQMLACPLFVPTMSEQKKVADSLDEISEAGRQLESIYQQKITALDELKKALLHKAFSGEL